MFGNKEDNKEFIVLFGIVDIILGIIIESSFVVELEFKYVDFI